MEILLKRTYEAPLPEKGDGYRVLVDKLWPRGLSHENFKYDLWEKQLAPSEALREWFHADPDTRGAEFTQRYRKEILSNPAFIPFVKTLQRYPTVTFLYSSRDEKENNAVVLRQAVLDRSVAQAGVGRERSTDGA